MDQPARLRLVADADGLDPAGRARFLAALDDAVHVIEAAARRVHDAGGPDQLAALERMGGMAKYDRRRRWYAAHRVDLAATLR